MINSIDRVVIVDDSEKEIAELIQLLQKQDVDVSVYSPSQAKDIILTKNRQLLFFDLSMNDNISITDNISTLLRPILSHMIPRDFGAYGLIIWTKHMEDVQKVQEKIQKDKDKYPLPLFVLGLDKSIYISNNNYDSLFEDLSIRLQENAAASFFFNWRHSVDVASDNALNYMYQIVPDYDAQAQQFPYLLYQMAQNYSGIPTKDMQVYDGMYKDAYRAFDELLYSDLISQQSGFENIFPKQINKPDYKFEEELEQIAKINSKLLLELFITDPNVVMPGNVYQVMNNNDFLEIGELGDDSLSIAIELTPPCDFSNKKVSSRLIGGFMADCPKDKKELKKFISSFKAENKYSIWPVEYEGEIKFICFDFRNIYIDSDTALKNVSSYKLLFMVKHRLFADILQKFSSHAARLGLSIVQPSLK